MAAGHGFGALGPEKRLGWPPGATGRGRVMIVPRVIHEGSLGIEGGLQ